MRRRSTLLRLCFLGALLLVSSAILVAVSACRKQGEQQTAGPGNLTVVSYGGGAWQDSHKKAFIEPFEKINGADITSEAWNAEYAKLKTDVDNHAVKWDVVEVTAAQFVRGKRDGIFEPQSTGLMSDQFVRGAIDPQGVANVYWSTVMAWSKDSFGGRAPASWKDFWDVTRFPGARALYDDPRANLEIALLADGVDARHLYPLDVERAFRSLDRIKPYVRIWWTDGSQPIQLLTTQQVALSSAWNGRLFAARSDAPGIRWSWAGAALDLDWWVIPKGAPHPQLAQRFIWFASQACPMAEQARLVGYGPANIAAVGLLPPELQRLLPTHSDNLGQQFFVDSAWWADHESDLQKRWSIWKASR